MPFNFDAAEEYILEDDLVLLRPLQAGDLEHFLPFAVNEPETWRFSNISAAGEQGMQQYITDALALRQTAKEYPFIVFDKQTQSYAGCTRFYDIQPNNLTLQLGYTWYGGAFRGSGLNKHCKYLMLNFAFETLGVERVEFRADNNNARSIAAMKGIGCVVEGVLRSNATKPDGTRRNSIVLSILKGEWFGGVKETLYAKLT